MNAPRVAASCISATDIETGVFIAWVTIRRCTPCRFASRRISSVSCGAEWPVASTRSRFAMTAMTSFTAGSSSPFCVTGTNGRFSFEVTHLVLGVERRHPDDAAPAAGDGGHVLDGGGVDPADRQVQRDAAEHLDAGHDLANEVGQAGRRVVVVLQDDGALLPRVREPGHLEWRRSIAAGRRDSCARGRRSSPRAAGRDRCLHPWPAIVARRAARDRRHRERERHQA